MKRRMLSLTLAPLLLFSLLPLAHAGYYTIKPLSDNPSNDLWPSINADGRVVWYGWDGDDDEIFLYDGTTTIQLTDNEFDDNDPHINASGIVVWAGSVGPDKEIFLYDGTSTTQLTDNEFDDNDPHINASGIVVWAGSDGFDDEIFLYDGTGTAQLTDNDYDDTDPRINAGGQVVWCGQAGTDHTTEIFLYDGAISTRLTDDGHDDDNARISDNGQVVWTKRTSSYSWDVLLYNGSTITKLSGEAYSISGNIQPQINAGGQVVWEQEHPLNRTQEIFLFDGSTTTLLTAPGLHEWAPHLNDNGWVVWCGEDPLSMSAAVFVYDGTTTTMIPQSQSPGIESLRISNNGQVTWSSYVDSNYDVFLATYQEIWIPSSVAGAGDATASDAINHLFLLMVPAGGVLAWKVRRSARVRRNRSIL